MSKRKIWTGTLIIIVSVFYFGCSESSGKKLNETVVNVEVHQVSTFNGNEEIAYSGTIEESESTPLSFSGVGTVARVLVSEGDFIKIYLC